MREGTVLLAVDVGVRTGLAGFSRDGALLWWASRNFGSVKRLKHAIPAMLGDCPDLTTLVVEGDGRLAILWRKAARDLQYHWISAETWREELLIARERRSGERAKATAVQLAREHVERARLPGPRELGHDAAEAILVGVYASVHLLETWPQSAGHDFTTPG